MSLKQRLFYANALSKHTGYFPLTYNFGNWHEEKPYKVKEIDTL